MVAYLHGKKNWWVVIFMGINSDLVIFMRPKLDSQLVNRVNTQLIVLQRQFFRCPATTRLADGRSSQSYKDFVAIRGWSDINLFQISIYVGKDRKSRGSGSNSRPPKNTFWSLLVSSYDTHISTCELLMPIDLLVLNFGEHHVDPQHFAGGPLLAFYPLGTARTICRSLPWGVSMVFHIFSSFSSYFC